jgi:regulatory protein
MEELGRITSVERQKRSKSRVSVFVDGAYLGSVEDIVWARSGLNAGDALDAAKWEDMLTRQDAQAALDRALTRLASRARSRSEMENYLLDRGFSEDSVKYALEKLEGYGYIDDGEFAAMLVRDRMRMKHAGRRAIAGELKRMGVDEEEAASALAQYGEADEAASALAQAEKDMTRTAREPDARKRRAKVYASLARRGFSHDVIQSALSKLFNGREEDGL